MRATTVRHLPGRRTAGRSMRPSRVALVALLTLAALPAIASAQRPRRRPPTGGPIEIRGQVPTPQVVTVRPREVPEFSRQVLVPSFYDRRVWPSILPGYQLVPRRALVGALPSDSALAAAARPGGVVGSPAPATVPPAPPVPPALPAPSDSTRRPPGTPPAR